MDRLSPKKSKLMVVSISIALIFGTFSGCKPRNKASSLPVDMLRDSSKDLVGNKYEIEGRLESLISSSGEGRLFAVKIISGATVAIYAPSTLQGFNPERGQSFLFKVTIDPLGVLVVTKAEKI